MDTASDGIALLKVIKVLSELSSTEMDPFQTVLSATLALLTVKQGSKTIGAYRDHVDTLTETLKYAGGTVCSGVGIYTIAGALLDPQVKYTAADPDDPNVLAEEAARDRFISRIFLNGSNPRKYGKLVVDLHNEHLRRKPLKNSEEVYPKDLNDAVRLLLNWQSDGASVAPGNEGVSFLHDTDDQDDVHDDDNFADTEATQHIMDAILADDDLESQVF